MINGTISQHGVFDQLVPSAVPAISASSADYGMIFEGVLAPLSRRRVTTLDTVQTVTGKTMSSVSNDLDARRIRTVPVAAAAPAVGNYLAYDGAEWTPQDITATAPAAFSAGNISVNVGSTAGTVAAGDDPRFSTPQRVVVKSGAIGAGEYNSVAAAAAAITDAGPLKPYAIQVFPGIYVESPFTLPAWCRINGVGSGTAILQLAAPSAVFITLGTNTAIESVSFRGPGTTALYVDSCTNCVMTRMTFTGFTNPVSCRATTAVTDLVIYNSMFAGFTTAISADGTALSGPFRCSVTSHANIFYGNASSAAAVDVRGVYADFSTSSGRISGLSTGSAIYLEDGCALMMQGTYISDCRNGLVCANVGAGQSLRIAAITMMNISNSTLSITNPAASGVINCVLDRNKISIDPGTNFAINITDPVDIGTAVAGELYFNPEIDGQFTEIGEQITHSSSLGVYKGGDITDNGGLTILVTAGRSYTVQGVDPNHKLTNTNWSNTVVTLPASSVSYIYADPSNNISSSPSAPDVYSNTILGRVGTTATGIEFIDPQKYNSEHPATEIIKLGREVFGALFATGGFTTVNPALEIAVSSGEYYFSNNEVIMAGLPSGGDFYAYYHTGGIWTRSLENTLDNSRYDNGNSRTAASAGKYIKHSLYTVGTGIYERYFLVYSQAEYGDINAVTNGPVPMPPPYFSEGIVLIAAIILQQGNPTYSVVQDLRPTPRGAAAAATAVSDHGNLTGLLDDDHPQYLPVNGSRAMTGTLNMGSRPIINITTANGVTIEAHATRHLPNGADPLATAAPLTTLTATTPNSVGTANSFARSDHTHAIDQSTFTLNSISGTLGVAKGGTGATTFAANAFIQGNGGAAALTAVKAIPTGDVVGTTDTQTISGKTLDSAANTLTITSAPLAAANINTVLNQSLLTTSVPTFGALNIAGSFRLEVPWTATVTGAAPVTVAVVPVPAGQVIIVTSVILVVNSTDNTSGVYKTSSRVHNLTGSAVFGGYIEEIKNTDSTGFTTADAAHVAAGTDLLVRYGGDAGKTHNLRGTTWIYL